MTNKEILGLEDKDKIIQALNVKYPGSFDDIKHIINLIGDDTTREGLQDTPYRVVKSWLELYGGYEQDPKQILSTSFEDDIGDLTDEIVMCRNIQYYSTCEHHMIPFNGVCHIGYLPNKKVVGLSKLARLVDCFSRRLQIQEKLTSQIADTLMDELKPQGVGVIMTGIHFCMRARGVKNQTSEMITSAMRGKFKTQPQTRSEFLTLIKIKGDI